ncbi:hypothetical protein CHS0354_006775 [Potamilus streckersoni]|nr:hypothetical protein CHS0354_006775 [Potamilus streckersoni]
MNIPDYYKAVSLKLTEVLDASGLREDIRWLRINTSLETEELETICHEIHAGHVSRVYFFGSQAEATTTLGLLSDIDKVSFVDNVVVLHDIQFWKPSLHTLVTLLMVADERTPPGYVKLQLVQRDAPMTIHNYQDKSFVLDSEGRSVLSHGNLYVSLSNPLNQGIRNGPAITTSIMGETEDFVWGLWIRCCPDQVSRWMSTSSHCNWPTRPIMDVIKQTAVFLVPVGQKLSHQQHLQWRLSFSFAEKLLMMQFNPTQYKCYVMLKFIKSTFINVHDVGNVLTSYHCKTCMFYLIEDTPASLWHPHNLMLCMDLCLRLLLSWVQSANCPNFFVPDENMFLGKLTCPVQGKIARTLQDLLQQKGRYITKISYDNIGENVVRVCQSLSMELYYPDESILSQTIVNLMRKLEELSFHCVWSNLCKLNIFKSRHGPRQEIGNVLRALICSVLGNHLASQSIKQEIYHQEKLILAHEILLLGSYSDVASGKLKLAAFYLARGMLDEMEEVINQVDANFTHNVFEALDLVGNLNAVLKILQEHHSKAKFIQKCLALTVYYSKLDIHCIPKVLIFEIFRSTGSKCSLLMLALNGFPIALVTARVYLYFLQYQCFYLQGRVAQRIVALNNMIWVSKDYYQKCTDLVEHMNNMFGIHVFHTEFTQVSLFVTTSMNLLAYCLKQDGRPMDAFKVLCLSMNLFNQNNGAKWQIAIFINSVIRILWGRQ